MSKQSGETFVVEYVGPVDTNGIYFDGEAHLHVFENRVQTSVLTRTGGDVTYDAVTHTYRADVQITAPAIASFYWHFPSIEFISPEASQAIHGPVLTEPTT